MTTSLSRRTLIKAGAASVVLSGASVVKAQEAQRHFDPQPQGWRTFDVTTTVQLRDTRGDASLWLPLASLDTPWQRTLATSWEGNSKQVRISPMAIPARGFWSRSFHRTQRRPHSPSHNALSRRTGR